MDISSKWPTIYKYVWIKIPDAVNYTDMYCLLEYFVSAGFHLVLYKPRHSDYTSWLNCSEYMRRYGYVNYLRVDMGTKEIGRRTRRPDDGRDDTLVTDVYSILSNLRFGINYSSNRHVPKFTELYVGVDSTPKQEVESIFAKIKRSIKRMFEEKTIVEDFEVVEIHPDFVADIAKKVAVSCELSFKEKDGKFYLYKGSIFPIEITAEKLQSMIVKRVKGKEWSAVSKSAMFKIADDLELIELISFRRPNKNIEDLIT